MIRKITESDRNIINDIIKSEFSTNYEKDSLFSNWYIYELDKNIVGFINYDTIYEQAELEYIFVDKNYRNKGIASELLNKMTDDLRQKNINQITLEVRVDNEAAISFYEKNGFKKVSIRKNYYGNVDAFLMLKSW